MIGAAALIQLADDDGDGQVDVDKIADVIASADGVVDSYLAGLYTVPLVPVPVTIRDVSRDLAAWNLYSSRGVSNDLRKLRRDEALKYLEALQRGTATLGGGTAPDPIDESGGIAVSRDASERVFTLGTSVTSGTLDRF